MRTIEQAANAERAPHTSPRNAPHTTSPCTTPCTTPRQTPRSTRTEEAARLLAMALPEDEEAPRLSGQDFFWPSRSPTREYGRWSQWAVAAFTVGAGLTAAVWIHDYTSTPGGGADALQPSGESSIGRKDAVYDSMPINDFTSHPKEGDFEGVPPSDTDDTEGYSETEGSVFGFPPAPQLEHGEEAEEGRIGLMKAFIQAPSALLGLFRNVGRTAGESLSGATEDEVDEASEVEWSQGRDSQGHDSETALMSEAQQAQPCAVPDVMPASNGQSLFCWALMIPYSYEAELLTYQFAQSSSIFGCDDYSVYSNQVVQLSSTLKTTMVNVDLHCEKGGEFGTALNTRIFVTVWSKIFEECSWQNNDWTVKADPDTVFFPSRLRQMLPSHGEESRGVYINNCNLGMHGPIEVFSRNAVRAWKAGHKTCTDHFYAVCRGDCEWGEDMFMDQCLSKVLGVRKDFEMDMLLEENCNPSANWRSCTNPRTVAFHPFKSIGDYQRCLVQGQSLAFR